jgi:multidrug resistance efflux pump
MKGNRFALLLMAALAVLVVSLAVLSPRLWKDKAPTIKADKITVENMPIAAKGMVESEEKLEVSNQVMGLIAEIRVNEGDQVEKGQVLAVLDNNKVMTRIRLSEAQLREARAHLKELETGSRQEDIEMAKSGAARSEIVWEKAKNEYERQNRLYQKQATTLVEFERAEEKKDVAAEDLREAKAHLDKLIKGARAEEVEQARAVVEKAASELNYYQALLQDYTITSPIHGLIAEKYRDAGETVDIGTPILKIVNPLRLRIRAQLEETDVGRVSEGQSVEVTVDAYRNKTYRGEVYQVIPVLKRFTLRVFDPSAGYDINAQNIYASLHDFSGLKDGMQVTVKFLE